MLLSDSVTAPLPHIICIAHNTQGVPAVPLFETLITGPDAGQITIRVKTIASGASGVSSPDQGFCFLITPVLDGRRQDQRRFDFPEYVSGEFVSIIVGGLEKGRSYTFNAMATNVFGSSESASSPPQFAGTGTYSCNLIGIPLYVITSDKQQQRKRECLLVM